MQITTIGLDLAKAVFQVHGVDASGKAVLAKALRRGQLVAFFAKMPPCLVGMEACEKAIEKARKKAQRNGAAIMPQTLIAAEWMILVTPLPKERMGWHPAREAIAQRLNFYRSFNTTSPPAGLSMSGGKKAGRQCCRRCHFSVFPSTHR